MSSQEGDQMASRPKLKTTPDERAAQEYCKYFEQRSRGSRSFSARGSASRWLLSYGDMYSLVLEAWGLSMYGRSMIRILGRPAQWASVLGCCGMILAAACGNDKPAASGVSQGPVRDTTIRSEACSGRAEAEDANGDGKPDITRYYKGSAEVCRSSDFDRDGKPELITHFDGAGQVRRRESDYDGNGRPESIEVLEGGRLVSRQMDTQNHGKIDTWETFDGAGKIRKRERDTNGDGRIDQWWSWESGQLVLMTDKNGDGLPDQDTASVWGPEGLMSQRAAAASAAAKAAASSAPSAAASASAPPPPKVEADAGAGDDGGARRRR
jgi:hypothetical protein